MTALQKNLRCCCLKPKPKIPEKDIKIINRRVNKMSFNKRSIGSWWQLIQMDHSRAVGPWKVPSGLKSRHCLSEDLRLLRTCKYDLYITTQFWCMIIIIIWMHDHVMFIRMKWSTLSNAALQSKKTKTKTKKAVWYICVHTEAMQEGRLIFFQDFSKKNWWDLNSRETCGL